jgi:S1-C subfamily serine protease
MPASPRQRSVALASIGVAAILAGAAGLVWWADGGRLSSSTSTPSTSPEIAYGSGPASGANGSGGGSGASGGSGATGGSGTGSGSVDPAAVAASVDPAIVDITSSLVGGTAAGTGMVITSGGEVLTNNHVIDGATHIDVQINGTGALHTARVIAADPADDVALLQIQGVSGLRTVPLGDSSKAQVGDSVLAIGNALGRSGTPSVAQGQITQLGQTITATDDTGANAETLSGLIQVDAHVLPGDSGGPLVNTAGQVIGMDTAASATHFRRYYGTGVGFAIPINAAMTIVHKMQSGQWPSSGSTAQAAQHGLLGVSVEDASVTGTSGALVVGVQSGSAAASVGIAAGDVIVGLGGQSVGSSSALHSAVAAHKAGDRVDVSWLDQSGQQQSATLQLGASPAV